MVKVLVRGSLESYSAYHQEKFMQEMESISQEIPDNEKEEVMFKKLLLS